MSKSLVEKFKDLIGENEIFIFRGNYSPNLVWINWSREDGVDDRYKFIMPYFALMKGNETLVVADNTIYRKVSEDMFKKYLNKEIDLDFLITTIDKRYSYIDGLFHQYDDNSIKKLSNQEFQDLALDVKDNAEKLVAETLFIEQFDKEIALSAMKSGQADLVALLWEESIEPVFESFDFRRKKIILQTLQQLDIDNAVFKLSFIYSDYWIPKSYESIKEDLQKLNIQDIKTEIEYSSQSMNRKKSEFEEWRKFLSEEERNFADYIQFIMRARDERKDPIGKFHYLLYLLSVEACRRIDIDIKYSYLISSNDLAKGIDFLLENKKEIINRVNGVCALAGSQDIYEISSCEYDFVYAELEEKIKGFRVVHTQEIRGSIACKGIVRGIARVVLDPRVQSFNDGEILVTGMTRPEYLPIMKKSAAVVTDEGGITCHAAIVSRELNIPCIIGTKNATQIIKDGDLIEVDADNGIVRIIK